MESSGAADKASIGVVLATYNGEKYIKQQLDSVLAQTRKPELIVISDGKSTDQTVLVCEETLRGKGVEYRIMTSDVQLSVRHNFQKALINCDTDYIFFCDQDDVWEKHKIETTMLGFVNNSVCMVFTNAQIVDDNLNPAKKNLWESIGFDCDVPGKIFRRGSKEYVDILFRHNVVTGMCMAITKDLKEIALPFTENSIHDVWLAFLAIDKGDVVAINKKCVLYRQHGNNVVGTQKSIKNSLRHKDGYYGRILKRIKFIEDVSVICKEKALCDKYNDYLLYLYKRKDFLDRKASLFTLFNNLMDYRKYEHKWKEIVFKDLFIRWG